MSNDRQTGVMFTTQRGKWGMASFTSTRAIGKLPGPQQPQASQATSASAYAYDNSEEATAQPTIAAAATTPKPRKFFKSRSASVAVQEPVSVAPQQNYASQISVAQEAPIAPVMPPAAKGKAKQSKKKAAKATAAAVIVQEQQQSQQQPQFVPPPTVETPPMAVAEAQPEPAQFIPQPSVSQDRIRETIPSKRYLARARKVQVNYNEDESSQPTAAVAPTPAVPPITIPISAVSPSMEHPPIVLRISKGTSRLVSTDSEEAINASPPHQSFTSPSSSFTTHESPANGVVREDLPSPTATEASAAAAVQQTTPKATRKRRTAAAKTTTVAPVTPETPPGQPRRTTRAIRRQKEEEDLRSEQEQTACEEESRPRTPQPGSENYDLYRILASSPQPEGEEEGLKPEEETANIQSTMIPEPNPQTVPEEEVPKVQKAAPARRGRKKKADAVAEVVNDVVPEPVAAPKPATTNPTTSTTTTGRGRGRKAKAAVPVVDQPEAEQPTAELTATPSKKQKLAEPESSPVIPESPRRSTRGTAAAAAQVTPTKAEQEPRAGAVVPSPVVESPSPAKAPPVRSYGRKKKAAVPVAEETTTPVIEPSPVEGKTNGTVITPMEEAESTVAANDPSNGDEEKPSVKLVITKKKGSIFKSRALASNDEVAKNRPVYKHKWDGDGEGGTSAAAEKAMKSSAFDDTDFEESGAASKPSTIFKPHHRALAASNSGSGGGASGVNSGAGGSANAAGGGSGGGAFGGGSLPAFGRMNEKRHDAFYTVKQAHQIQEIGEFQEMDDDVEYILDTLQPKYPILTRCLSAMQLSTKCMTPEFRMHVRAHGTVTQFFRVLQDAPRDKSLALCTASILFVLSQDNIGMDLDRESLELMLNLLDCDEVEPVASANPDDLGLTEQQALRNKMKVRELCEEVKAQGKAQHLNLDNVTVGTLAMETLLSLTSKRAGEWFKEELRNLGGLEHIVKTICECCQQISDYVAVWTEGLLEKLRKIERCLRVLENVMEMNEQNQQYILNYDNGSAINILVKLYKLCDTELALYPTTASSPKDSPGVAIREALVPTLKVLIALTHSFNSRAVGAAIVGEKQGIFDTSLHLLFHSSNYVPENCVFELSILVLLLLTNMTMHTPVNRVQIMQANALSDFGSQFAKVPAIKALVEFFYRCEESARLAEENADAILDAKPKKEKKGKGDEIEETVTKILQKAGNHMEHTIMASYVCILIGHLVMHDNEHRRKMSVFLRPDAGFAFMAKILEKYYNFLHLTASAEALTVAHIEATKKIIDYLTQCDTN